MLSQSLPQKQIIQFAFVLTDKVEKGLAPSAFEERYREILCDASDAELESLAHAAANAQVKELRASNFEEAFKDYLEHFLRERRTFRCERLASNPVGADL